MVLSYGISKENLLKYIQYVISISSFLAFAMSYIERRPLSVMNSSIDRNLVLRFRWRVSTCLMLCSQILKKKNLA